MFVVINGLKDRYKLYFINIMSFNKLMPQDYYQLNIVKEFNNIDNNKVNQNSSLYLRNIPKLYKLTLNHIELIEYFVRLLKPKNFLELGVQFGEATKNIIPNVLNTYYAVDIERSTNIDYFQNNYNNFKFYQQTTDEFFKTLKKENINLNLEMVFIDACHTHEASYRDFLNVKDHLVNDGIIFFHDTYPKNIESTHSDLSGDCYKTAEKIRKEHSNEFEILTIPVEPGLSIARKVERQLDWLQKKESVGFIIAACIRSEEHLIQLNTCIASIKRFNQNDKIVVVFDYTSNKELQEKCFKIHDDIIFEINTPEVPADMLLLKYFKEKKYFDKAILLQDSMVLKKHMDINTVNDVKFIWHFTNHRREWHIIEEPQTEFNIINNIKTHDDLNIYVINNLISSVKFQDYCKKIYYKKNEWCGCFGPTVIITHNFLLKVDLLTDIINLQQKMITNRLRRSNESIISLAYHYVTGRNMEDSYDGLYYDGIGGHGLNGKYIYKVAFNRQEIL